jgi:hypothetical protein
MLANSSSFPSMHHSEQAYSDSLFLDQLIFNGTALGAVAYGMYICHILGCRILTVFRSKCRPIRAQLSAIMESAQRVSEVYSWNARVHYRKPRPWDCYHCHFIARESIGLCRRPQLEWRPGKHLVTPKPSYSDTKERCYVLRVCEPVAPRRIFGQYFHHLHFPVEVSKLIRGWQLSRLFILADSGRRWLIPLPILLYIASVGTQIHI